MKSKFLMMMVLSILCLGFVSCSDDDDDKDNSVAAAVSSDYNGTFDVSLNGQKYTNKKVVVTKKSDTEVTLSIAAGEIMEMIPAISASAIISDYDAEEGYYDFEEATLSDVTLAALSAAYITDVAIEGYWEKGEDGKMYLDLTITGTSTQVISGQPMQIPFTVNYKGVR